jgi:hypothetical protein
VIEQNASVLERPESITPPLHHCGLRNLASAVTKSSAEPVERVSQTEPESKPERVDAAQPTFQSPAAPLPEAIRLEEAVQANERLEALAHELSTQVRELAHQRDAFRLKLAGAFTLSAVLTAWGLTAAVMLMQ